MEVRGQHPLSISERPIAREIQAVPLGETIMHVSDNQSKQRLLLVGLVSVFCALTFAFPDVVSAKTYCALEVGSKGVKARLYSFGETKSKGDSPISTRYSKEINTTIVASMKDGQFTASAVDETAAAAGELLNEMRQVNKDCIAFAVGSSGVAKASNKDELAAAVSQKTGLAGMDFVSSDQEAEFGFSAVVPEKWVREAVLVDIGSGNTKIGYFNVMTRKFASFEVPYGTVTLSKKATEVGGANFQTGVSTAIDRDVMPALRTSADARPGALNRRRVFWIGGAAWATATFTRPDAVTDNFVTMKASDIRKFLKSLSGTQWADAKPTAKASKKVKQAFADESTKVLEIFTRENLVAGVGLFNMFLQARGVDGPIIFARNSQWIYGYTAAKFADEIWAEDAIEQHL
jgi:hypothetical protein